MPELRYSLLRDRIFGVRDQGGGDSALSLAGVLAALSGGESIEFSSLQRHQHHAWYAFCVQLAVIALHDAGERDPPDAEARWRDLLLGCTNGAEEPWGLVVEDLALPAFMQPPVPEGTLAGFKNVIETPDGIDVLLTSRNHDVKRCRFATARAEHWAYALVALQTLEGFLGAGNYGIARMNGGFASRPCAALAPSLRWGERFLRDLDVLAEARDALAKKHDFLVNGGLALLWLQPWDGEHPLVLADCDPYCVEVCRRVRLSVRNDGILACTKPTKGRRLEADALKGNLGDPWTPVHKRKGTALNVGQAGFTYRRAHDLLFGGDFEPGAALRRYPSDGTACVFVGFALARGQGRTDGIKERYLPVPRKAALALGSPRACGELALLAKHRVEAVERVERRVLRVSLCALLQGGADKLDFRDDRTSRWCQALDAEIDRIFFARLWDAMDLDPAEGDRQWSREVLSLAERQLQAAIVSAPLPSARRYRAIARAEGMFHGLARKHFPDATGRTSAEENSG